MLPRFEGPNGKDRLAEVLTRQNLVHGDSSLARDLTDIAVLMESIPGTESECVLTQGGADNDVYFIISGSLDIFVNGRHVATRQAGTHVGEMALIDPTARRSATAVAHEPSVLVRVSEVSFSALADRYPRLWRTIAVDIGNRLRERNRFLQEPHNQPVVFIGSSSEDLEIANEIQFGLSRDPMVVSVWNQGIFLATHAAIESLVKAVADSDFAVLVVSPNDLIKSRGVDAHGPRDNVIFELGLFIGGIGRERTFFICPKSVELKIPTDLLGVTPLEYVAGCKDDLRTRLGPVCTELRRIILKLGAK